MSYSPALTQILLDEGLGDHIVGVDSHSPSQPGRTLTVVGDAIQPNAEAIVALKPDLVLTQTQVERFAIVLQMDRNIRVEHFTMETFDDIARAMERVGELAGARQRGLEARRRFEDRIADIARRTQGRSQPRVLFVMDHRKPFTGGSGTFVDDMIRRAGGQNAAGKLKGWQAINSEEIILAAPDVLVCQSPVADAADARAYWAHLTELPAVRENRVFVVTEDDWTIPSPRIVEFLERLSRMTHPQAWAQDSSVSAPATRSAP